MAVDTANKRFSMFSMGRPMVPTLPFPDGGFTTAADRAQLEFRYRGIVEPPPPGGAFMIRGARRRARIFP